MDLITLERVTVLKVSADFNGFCDKGYRSPIPISMSMITSLEINLDLKLSAGRSLSGGFRGCS